MLFLDLLFCGQTQHRSKYLGCAPFGQKLQMQPMPFFTAPAAPIQKMQILLRYIYLLYDEESDHSNKAVRKTPEIESGHKVSEEVK